MNRPLLNVRDLCVHYPARDGFFTKGKGVVKAVDGVSFDIARGDVLGIVGESGCGKSTVARALTGLAPITSGEVVFDGIALADLSRRERLPLRRRMQLVFQDPYASLDPRMTIFDTLAEPLRAHRIVPRGEVTARVAALMERVGLSPQHMRKYPHEFSGGQRQRIALARALSVGPQLVIADEPVSALDVSVQAQVLNLFARLRQEEDLTLLFIAHDLSVVKHIAHRVAVMYLGRIVETGIAREVFGRPLHPYTQALVQAAPIADPQRARNKRRTILQGEPPSPLNPPSGCPFHPRCPIAGPKCRTQTPALEQKGPEHWAACLKVAADKAGEGD